VAIVRVETFVREPVGVVRVTADDGTTGTGQVAPFHAAVAALVVHDQLARHVLGVEPDDVDAVVTRCRDAEQKFVGSHLSRALAGLDTALWDLRARRAGVPVCVLAGGRPGSVAVYGSDTSRRRTGVEQARRLLDAHERHGFGAFKVKVGTASGPRGADGDEWPGRTGEVVDAVGGALAGVAALMVDGNGSFSPRRAVEVGRRVESHGGVLVEEPCPHGDHLANAEVAAALAVPVGLGEQEHDLDGFARIVAAGAADVLQPDVGYVGGFSTALAVTRLATARGLAWTPHAANRSLVAVQALHLRAAARGSGPPVELALATAPWAAGLYQPALEVIAGQVVLTDAPGWGVDVPPAWLARASRRVSELEGSRDPLATARHVARRAGRGAWAAGGAAAQLAARTTRSSRWRKPGSGAT
jgi:L-alanine-DL-glutamate epimerase-like enolase superfamily enzyme